MRNTFLTLLFAIIIHPVFSQSLSKKEETILKEVEKLDQESISFLERVINSICGTLNFEGVLENSEIFGEVFREIGFDTNWYDLRESVNRAGHLFEERKEKKGKRLLLIGHLDTIFDRDSPLKPLT
ncbi:MAG: hypothetical protein AAFQ94_01545 [Bacteroidota bacterium]